MFKKIYDKKFKPFSEEKLKAMLTPEEIDLIPHGIDFKLYVAAYCENNLDNIHCECGNPISYKTYRKGIFPAYCSKSCAAKGSASIRQASKLKNFGSLENYSSYVSEVQKKNSIEKYGVTHQKRSRNKSRETLLARYGVEHNSLMESVQEKRKINQDGNYIDPLNSKESVESASKSRAKLNQKIIQQKIRKTRMINSDIKYDILLNPKKMSSAELAGVAGCGVMTAYRYLNKAGLMTRKYTQDTVMDYVQSLGFECYETRKIIAPYELDIYIPEKQIAIEYNGLYWHSSGDKRNDKIKSKYHLMKTEMCESKGIQLLHIFENEWLDPLKREIWKSVIRHKLGLSIRIPARKCTIKQLQAIEYNEFLTNNHLQGSCKGTINSYGLFYENELVQVITVGKPRYSKGYDFELLRMCTKKGYVVQGGFSKLLKRINGTLITYANRRWSIGNAYGVNGLKLKSISSPCYWYIDKGKLYHRTIYMKHKLERALKDFDPSKSECENCYANGLRRIWDCGNLIYCKE